MTTIGAVVLTYNKAWVLDRFWSSLKRQTRELDQVVVVDDASTDATPTLLSDLDLAGELILSRRNAGQSAARNRGLRKLKTDLVICLDADIEMRPDMLALLEAALHQDPQASFAYCHYDRRGSRTDHVRAMPWAPDRLLYANFISTISLCRREHLPRPVFDRDLRRYEDWDLWLRMARQGRSGVLVNEILFTAHYHPGDLSGQGESLDWYNRVRAKHGLTPISPT